MDRPGTQLLEVMQPNDRVILVDAVSGSKPLGSIVRLGLDDIKAGNQSDSQPDNQPGKNKMSTHNIGLADTLELGDILQRLPRQILLMGLETGGNSDWQYSQAELEQLVSAVRAEACCDSTLIE